MPSIPSRITDWPDDAREAYEERAAIMEYDGGLARGMAEYCAAGRIRAEWARYPIDRDASPDDSPFV